MSPGVTPARPPVMGDVAKLAGVSHQTVSRVLNNHPNVSGKTKERVESAIASFGLPAQYRCPELGDPALQDHWRAGV